jgi:hypothetical protein
MEDDARSVASGGSAQSATNTKIECPECKKEVQTRVIFNHIRAKHPKYLLDSTLLKWINEAAEGHPLKVMWEKKNDFDEMEDVTLYACLSTNKTFTIEARAIAHFKKNPAARKDHIKQAKQLIKDIAARSKDPRRCPVFSEYLDAKRDNCPLLARIIWRAIQFHEIGCLKIIYEVEKRYTPEAIEKYVMRANSGYYSNKPTLRSWLDSIKDKLASVKNLREEKCLEVDILGLHSLHLETFIYQILPLLQGEVFDWMFCVGQDECVRPRPNDLDKDMYYLASHKWPSVDF